MMLLAIYVIAVVSNTLGSPVFEPKLVEDLQRKLKDGVAPERVFRDFKIVFNRTYSDATEENMRRGIFIANAKDILDHNNLYDRGEKTFTVAINQFTDMTRKEVNAFYTGLVQQRNPDNGSQFLVPENVRIPNTVDWREKGLVTPVKNQGSCGSCWAFSATGSLEGQLARKTQKLVSLSEQQLVDCSKENHGCGGGSTDLAFSYTGTAGGLESEKDYPYTGKESTCKVSTNKLVPGTRASGFTRVKSGSETALQEAVATVGPLHLSIDASLSSFHNYKSGIYYDPKCSSVKHNHAVLVVGYGSDGGDYWLVKNSWGLSWGEKGYIRMARNKGNNCGVATHASYPNL